MFVLTLARENFIANDIDAESLLGFTLNGLTLVVAIGLKVLT